jgi:ABC-type phosphate transport system substrate-binding protein
MVLILMMGGSAWAEEFVLVRNAENPTAELQANEVKDLYIGKLKQWPNSVAVQVVLTAENSPELAWLGSSFFGVDGKLLFSKIRQGVFRGEISKPLSGATAKETIEKISANKGAIGVVSAGIAKSLPAGVAVIRVAR